VSIPRPGSAKADRLPVGVARWIRVPRETWTPIPTAWC
jgi:hypothetical protein